MKKINFICLFLLFSQFSFAEGLVGIDEMVSGMEEDRINTTGEGVSVDVIDGIATTLGDAIYDAGIQTRTGVVPSPVVKPVMSIDDSGNPINEDVSVDVVKKKAPRKKKIIRLPKGVVTKKSNKDGLIVLTSSDKGTYAIETPPYLANQIKFPDDRYLHYTPLDDKYVDISKKGNIYFVTLKSSEAPVSVVFYSERNGEKTVSLVFLPNSSVINKTISVEQSESDKTPVETVVSRSVLKKIMVFESSNSSDDRTVSAHKLISKGMFPNGYEFVEVRNGVRGFICGERRLISRLGQKIIGKKYVFEIYKVTNISEDYFEFDESNCLTDSVASVQMYPGWTIAPSESKELIIQRNLESAPKLKNIRTRMVYSDE